MEQNTDEGLEQPQAVDKTKNAKRVKDMVIIVVTCVLFVGGVFAIIIFGEIRAFQSQSVEEIEGYLEEVFYDDFDVEFHWYEYLTEYWSEDKMPYLVEATMADGSTVVFSAYWGKGSNLESGVETSYEYNLIDHYAYQYGMDCEAIDGTYYTVEVPKEALMGDPPVLYQFLLGLEETNYYYAGQTFYLLLEPTDNTGVSHRMEVNWENPVDYEAVMKDLQMFEE